MKYNFRFRYYNGEETCPDALKNDGVAAAFWTMEKYVHDNYRGDRQEVAERAYDDAVKRGDFKNKTNGDWPNQCYFIHAYGGDATEDEKFTAYCVRRVDDFSPVSVYDLYFEGP